MLREVGTWAALDALGPSTWALAALGPSTWAVATATAASPRLRCGARGVAITRRAPAGVRHTHRLALLVFTSSKRS